MPRKSQDVTDAEMAVLQELWEQDSRSIRELADRLYPGGGNSESATVKKLCERLEAKGLVATDRSRRPHQYRATVDRQSWLGRKLHGLAERFCSGSVAPLVTTLIQGGRFSRDEIAELRELVGRLEEEETTGPKDQAPRTRHPDDSRGPGPGEDAR